MQEVQKFVPAKKSVVLSLLCIVAALIVLFAGVLRYSLRTAFVLNPAEYQLYKPENFQYRCTDTIDGGVVSLNGWACIEGERFQSVDTRIVLYNPEEGSYLRIPTTMQFSDEPLTVLGGEINYTFGGFTAFVQLKQLAGAPSGYEICIAYRCNQYNALVHTGQFVGEAQV